MEKLQYKVEKGGGTWKDETGMAIPYNRTTKSERIREKNLGAIVKDALKVNKALTALKEKFESSIDEIRQAIWEENDLPAEPAKYKGNYTFYNFDRSIKVEVSINETIRFDDTLTTAARQKLDAFIEKNVTGIEDVVRELINSAFHTSTGRLDPKKVLNLVRYRTKIKHEDFQDALNLIEKSISRPSSKRYYRVWVKDEQGQYQNIDLNFSSVELV